MTNQQILHRAIEKAISNGWDLFGWTGREWFRSWSVTNQFVDPPAVVINYAMNTSSNYLGAGWADASPEARSGEPCKRERMFELEQIIYDHDFANGLWGDGPIEVKSKLPTMVAGNTLEVGDTVSPAWMWHLREMVTSADPIAYLGEHLS